MSDAKPPRPSTDPWVVLGVRQGAGVEEVRAAYLRKVREHPPDRSPREFEAVRDAYEELRDPERRIARLDASLASILDEAPEPREFVGPEPWLEVLRRR